MSETSFRDIEPVGPSRPLTGWSLRNLDQARVHQLLVLFAATAILATMGVVISSMMVSGNYHAGPMPVIDTLTVLGLCLAILLAVRKQAPTLQLVLICMSMPANLFSEILLGGAGAWAALLLLGLSPFMWGLFAPVWLTILYSVGLISFFNIYLATASDGTILFDGQNETVLTALALSVICVTSALAAIVPRKITGTAYRSLKNAAHKESVLKQRFVDYAKLASDWHLEIDHDGRVKDFFGTGEAAGLYWHDIFSDWEGQATALKAALHGRKDFQKIKATFRTGTLCRLVECSGQPVFSEDGTFGGHRIVAHDITEKTEAQDKLTYLAMRDRLTGLKNRHAYNALIDSRQPGPGRPDSDATTVVAIDLDNFKQLNDRQGHAGGDAVLAVLGRRLLEFEGITPELEIFRLGGDEFCALLKTHAGPDRLAWLASRIEETISQPVDVDDRLIDLSASIGIACTSSSTTLAHALERADAAVYEAKSLGGGRVIIGEGEVQRRLDRRLAIRRDLGSAIASGEIFMHYQPIFEVHTGHLNGVEALARWTHPDYGIISPDEFIAIAEGSRDIIAMGQHTLRLSCAETLRWMEANGRSLRLNVNVSPVEMISDGFIGSLFCILRETGFPANLLELEITERGMLEDVEASRSVLNTLRAKGVTVSLDDFGTGYSSLSRLESLPVDRIKVDRSFFADSGENRRAQQLVALMSSISKVLDVEIVAEGIETRGQLDLVRLAGFAKVQGYLLGRPGSLEGLAAPDGHGTSSAANAQQNIA